ncbi:MAG: efflux RND transporter periplasmic adaptor subunit [Stappiaceae bacterium]
MKNIFLIFTVLVIACSGDPVFSQSSGKTLPSVIVQSAGKVAVENRESFFGRAEAVKTVAIQARIEGILEKRLFTEGKLVKAGETLYQINKAAFQADVDKAAADLAGAQATAKNAEIELERQRELLKKGDVAQSIVDASAATFGSDKAAVDAAAADLETAKINLGYTAITSPIDGRIGKTAINVGNLVSSSSGTLATITSIDPIYVNFFVSEKELLERREQGAITKDGSRLEVSIGLANGKEYSSFGTINFVDIEVQESSDTIELRAQFENGEGLLIPGQFVTVRLKDPEAKPVISVPQSALQLDQKGHFVFLVNEKNVVERRDVTLGQQLRGVWAVSSGLNEGDKVIVQGLQKVKAGEEVSPTEAENQASAGGQGSSK